MIAAGFAIALAVVVAGLGPKPGASFAMAQPACRRLRALDASSLDGVVPKERVTALLRSLRERCPKAEPSNIVPPAPRASEAPGSGPPEVSMSTYRFSHHRLDAFHVAKDALVRGTALANALPRGYATLADQTRRALLGAYLQLTEAAARDGADRRQRFRCSRAECNEAAAAIEAALALGLVHEAEAAAVLAQLDRLAAMLTRLGGFSAS